MQCLLLGTPWVGVTWHCWRRLSAAAMVAVAAPFSAVCMWNRRTSQRQAWEYTLRGPDWEFQLRDQAPWPHLVAGVTTLPVSSVQLWPANALRRRAAPDASSSPIIVMADGDDQGDDTNNGELGTPGAHRGVAPGGRERRARNPGRRQDAAQALRGRSSPPSQTPSPPVPQRCFVRTSFSARASTTLKRKPPAAFAAITAAGAG